MRRTRPTWLRMHFTSLEGRIAFWIASSAAAGVLLHAAVGTWLGPRFLAWLRDAFGLHVDPASLRDPSIAVPVTLLLLIPLAAWAGRFALRPLARLLRALEGSVASYRDGDFGFSVATERSDELGDLVRMHNDLGRTLREQRRRLVQRELLLDTAVQNTPVALVLADATKHVTYSNLAARRLFGAGRRLEGRSLDAVLNAAPQPLREALEDGADALVSVGMDDAEEVFHVSQRPFLLRSRPHRLYLFRRMTRELSRQEVATWKRVIRVISHELNNSLAPISSLAHSGAELSRRGDLTRLPGVFATIAERAQHLLGFIGDYADFAKLPAPRAEFVLWPAFLESLALHCRFRIDGPVPTEPGRFDAAQIEQVLINLIKNAHESGSPTHEVAVAIRSQAAGGWRVEVADRGPGMSEALFSQALLPFYSTKRAGTGLGLALAREIAEAHGGRVGLANREGGGLRVTLMLPGSSSPAGRDGKSGIS